MAITEKRQIANLTFNNAKIKWKNFAGEERAPFNKKGDRNFVIELDDVDQYEALQELGWMPKLQAPTESNPEPKPFLPVTVKYIASQRPPRAHLINSRGQVALLEDMIFALDFADIEKVDLVVRAFQWEFNGRTGVKAMLVSIYVTVVEDELERRYASIPEVDMRGNEVKAITGSVDYQNPFDGRLEDLGETAENQYALEQGKGF